MKSYYKPTADEEGIAMCSRRRLVLIILATIAFGVAVAFMQR